MPIFVRVRPRIPVVVVVTHILERNATGAPGRKQKRILGTVPDVISTDHCGLFIRLLSIAPSYLRT